ncbi:MAG: endonuclease/exonuclease/phosphatase family protein [Sphingobacterium sp.]
MYYILAAVFLTLIVLLRFYKRLKRKLISVIYPANETDHLGHDRGRIAVLTYNVAGLPQAISAAKMPRRLSITEIGDKISAFDIVNVQEDFNYNEALYSLNQHPYRTDTKGKIPIGDGLNTLSKFPILSYHRVPWRHCSGPDCWTVKGFSVSRVQLSERIIVDVYNVHANSSDKARAAKARRENLRQLANYILDHSAGHPLLVMGDFNAHYAYKRDNLHEFLLHTGLTDGWVTFRQKGVYPEVVPKFVAQDMLRLDNDVESLDKIFFRDSQEVQFVPVDYQVEIDQFTDGRDNPLSDHLAVSMRLDWKWKGKISQNEDEKTALQKKQGVLSALSPKLS